MPHATTFILILWGITLLAFAAPPVIRSVSDFMRGRKMSAGSATVFLLLAIVATMQVGNAIATKSEPTNPPPAAAEGPEKVIRLYVTSPDGHLVPLGAQIKGVMP